jgi:type I restriction enzyme S subunit
VRSHRGPVAIRSGAQLNRDFLFYQLLHLQPDIAGREGAVFASINKSEIEALPLAFTPIAEQKRIVGILDEAFEGIASAKANAERNVQNARALFESHLQSTFALQGEGWVERTLDDVCDQITDGKHGDCEGEDDSGYYFLSAKDIRRGTLNFENARQITRGDFEETHRRTNLEPGDILITNSGTIGRMAVAPTDDRTVRTTFQKSVAILKPTRKVIDSRFVFYCLSSGLTRFVNLSAGAAQKNLLLRDLRTYRFALPNSLEVQRNLAKMLDDLSIETQRLESLYQQKLDALDALKKSLLNQAFTGELTAPSEQLLEEGAA